MPAVQSVTKHIVITCETQLTDFTGPTGLGGVVGQPNAVATYAPVGGAPPYTWSVAGALPPGATFVPAADTLTAVLTVPWTAAGVWPIDVTCQCQV